MFKQKIVDIDTSGVYGNMRRMYIPNRIVQYHFRGFDVNVGL